MKKILFVVALMLMVSSAFAVDLEAGLVKPLAPDLTVNLGMSVGIGWGDIPEKIPYLGGHKLFTDFLYVDSNVALGASVALSPSSEEDNKLRLGASIWRESGGSESGFKWSVYLRNAVSWNW